ncbi:hypothetical protein BX666DRAFT_1425407 [Dichotomocladium elegans]|nr:hypothetical protein BX666DRAFT_1425407 [Dichotomocladium elegans]
MKYPFLRSFSAKSTRTHHPKKKNMFVSTRHDSHPTSSLAYKKPQCAIIREGECRMSVAQFSPRSSKVTLFQIRDNIRLQEFGKSVLVLDAGRRIPSIEKELGRNERA